MALDFKPFSIERAWEGWMNVQARVRKASAALEKAGVPYAVAGGNAVALWVARVDPGAVRATQDVDILIRRADFDRAKAALEAAGYVYRHAAGIDAFLEPPGNRFREGVHILFAGEQVRKDEPLVNPDVVDSEHGDDFQVLSLPALVRVKLSVFRDKDRTHLRDMIEVGLIDRTWLDRLPADLRDKLQLLFDTPES